MSTCRSCGADIVWAIAHGTEKPMPIDKIPVPDGNVAVTRDAAGNLMARVITPDKPLRAESEIAGVTHFATCPNANEHRRPR